MIAYLLFVQQFSQNQGTHMASWRFSFSTVKSSLSVYTLSEKKKHQMAPSSLTDAQAQHQQ